MTIATWEQGSDPTLVVPHMPSHDVRDRAERFARVKQALIHAIKAEGTSAELSAALQHIRTGFLWIAEHHNTCL